MGGETCNPLPGLTCPWTLLPVVAPLTQFLLPITWRLVTCVL